MSSNLPAVASVHCLLLAGRDARWFAQAQFTSDVGALAPGRWQWSAWLTPAGRVRALMQLIDVGEERLVALLRGGDAGAIVDALTLFRLRAQVSLALQVCALRAGAPELMATARRQAGCLVLGLGSRSAWLDPAPIAIDPSAQAAWRLADIRAGWSSLPRGEARHLAPALGLARLGALAHGKGCYPGQEVIARLHHRGGRTRRLYHVRGTPPLTPGEHVAQAGGRRVAVLDVQAGAGGCEALVIAPEVDAQTLTIDAVKYAIVTRFAA